MTFGSGFSNLIRISGFLSLRKKSRPYCVDLSSTSTVTVVYPRLAVRDLRRFAESFIRDRISAKSGAAPPLRRRNIGNPEAALGTNKVRIEREARAERKNRKLIH